ncbi:MAG: ABC transporter substrate-binding protein, partial [candidate division KSB1 bacterium]|nr:ABC transporter substrate-binding protein [candidate division KSB1 bacterium]
ARQLNINLPVIGGDALYYPTQLFAKGKDMVEGVMMTLFFHPSQKEEGVQKFVQSYWKKYGVMPEAVAALSYDAVYLLKTAMEQGGLSRSKIRDYLATVGSSHPAFKGVTGTIAFDENGDCVKPLVVGVVRHGEIVPLESP